MKIHNIVLADDHAVVMEGLRAIIKSDLRFTVSATFADAPSLLKYLAEFAVDLLVLDIDIPGAEKLKLLKTIKETYENLKVVIFTMHNGIQYFLEARNLGVDSYVLKTEPITFMPTILLKTLKGEFYCSEELKIHLSKKGNKDSLKPKEAEVLSLLARGLQYSEIAAQIGKSEKTIEYYVYKLRKKYSVNKNVDLLLKLSGEIILPEEKL